MSKALVKNAADPKQVREARRKEKSQRDQEIEDFRAVLATPQGRRVIWRFLGHCKVFESIWDPSSRIHHNAGKQDVGHFLMAEVVEADQEALLKMMRENGEVKEGAPEDDGQAD